MKRPDWKQLTKRRALGLAIMGAGLLVLLMPIFVGGWIIALLGIVLIGAGLFQFVDILRSADKTKSLFSYLVAVLTILLGFILFISPSLVLSGLVIAVTLFLIIDGAIKSFRAYKEAGQDRWWDLFNGLFTMFLGFVIWYFISAHLGLVAIGIVLGLRLLVDGWTMVFLPQKGFEPAETRPDTREHPDTKLGLQPSDTIREMQDSLLERRELTSSQDLVRCLQVLTVLFAIHVLRTDARWSFIGFISPFSAVVGDAVVALILGVVVVLPMRLFWRKLSRPLERTAWHRFNNLHTTGTKPTLLETLLNRWLGIRMKFALDLRENRYSLNRAFWRVLRLGLPLTAVIVAINSIWGFSWYFNSENWASGVWQTITQKRVDVWRQQMAQDAEKAAISKGVPSDQVFAVSPDGVTSDGDFSFIVIGDTGEGDPSQMALRDQLIAASKRDRVKFLVLSSDVIYPDGKMKDYETNFYLPFHGFEKPIYAIPGNHDWFDANEGFNANFLDRESAILSLRARLESDVKTNAINTDERFNEITNEADRLRKYYRIKNGLQRGPFFEFHTNGFSLIAVDTGILRTTDPYETAWLDRALTRAGQNFKLVVLGHPFYVGGAYTAVDDQAFAAIHDVLRRNNVQVAMAGDTHDFEFYKEFYNSNGKQNEMLHFVNGGGGAYLSIGTSIGFPKKPVTTEYAFYPRTDELTAKIKREAPFWKMPFLFWLRYLHGYPFNDEMVSGAFDFNRAPYFQSFLEVIVERSQKRVRMLLYGVNGQLRWRDIQVGGQVKPAEKSDDDFVEFIAPIKWGT
jgi:uncharacterized membrane protein HdeD (DUF308 family)